jgi:hypothetical protein
MGRYAASRAWIRQRAQGDLPGIAHWHFPASDMGRYAASRA